MLSIMENFKIIEAIDENAIEESLFCVKNPKYDGFKLKRDWLKERWKEGLKLKILKKDDEKIGFIEYTPGEFAWRPVIAENYLFIHCLMVYGKKNNKLGYGTKLINDCIEDAKRQGKSGVAVFTSKGSWIANKSIFIKNGFKFIETKDRFELLAFKFKDSPDPAFIDWHLHARKHKGLHLIYANQCPLFIKSVEEMKQTAKDHSLDLQVTILNTAQEAQQSPSGYGTYSLIYNGKLLSDHYISNTRFKNILNKEI